MDVMVVEVLNYEEKLNEFKEFVKKNFNIMFFVLFMLFLRNFLVFELIREILILLVVVDEIVVILIIEFVFGFLLEENILFFLFEVIVRLELLKFILKIGSVVKELFCFLFIFFLLRENNLKEKFLLLFRFMLGLLKVVLLNFGIILKSIIILKFCLKVLFNVVFVLFLFLLDVFRKDFNENINKKVNMFKYELKILFDFDFDFKLND